MGPIIIIEDDPDDQDIINLTLNELNVTHEIVFFDNPEKAFDYLSVPENEPFIIFSDINMPGMSGFELRDKIHQEPSLRMKCVPYIFLTTGGENKQVWKAYSNNAQGFFIKPTSMEKWRALFSMIISYWE